MGCCYCPVRADDRSATVMRGEVLQGELKQGEIIAVRAVYISNHLLKEFSGGTKVVYKEEDLRNEWCLLGCYVVWLL
jgi:hypothetical protein